LNGYQKTQLSLGKTRYSLYRFCAVLAFKVIQAQ